MLYQTLDAPARSVQPFDGQQSIVFLARRAALHPPCDV
jgi:hypothetical protein